MNLAERITTLRPYGPTHANKNSLVVIGVAWASDGTCDATAIFCATFFQRFSGTFPDGAAANDVKLGQVCEELLIVEQLVAGWGMILLVYNSNH